MGQSRGVTGAELAEGTGACGDIRLIASLNNTKQKDPNGLV